MRTKRHGLVRLRAAVMTETLEARQLLSASILGRYTFYGNSAYDTSSTSVQAAIATDKTALLPGQTASFANYTSYVKGINGIAIDAANWPAMPVASDFVIEAGNSATPSSWTTVTQTATFSIERGGGTGGSDRIVIRLPDNTYRNEWIQVTMKPTADTGLSSPDVFYFGNQVGDDGHSLTSAIIDSSNEAGARRDIHGFTGTASIADLYDFNRDGRVDITDQLIARQAVNTPTTALPYFTAPGAANPGTSGFTNVFNVRNYGAAGDGVTDDTNAILAAVAALSNAGNGLLYFPSGTYQVHFVIGLQNLTNIEIRGFGATLRGTPGFETSDISGDLFRLTNCSGFTVSGLTFDGNASQRTQSPTPCSLNLCGCSDFHVADCSFNNTVGDGIYICAMAASNDATTTHDGLIEDCSINSAFRNGISIIHGSRLQIAGNVIQNVAGAAPQSGIDIEANANDSEGANHDITISGNRFTNDAVNGVAITYTQDPYNVTVDSNQFSGVPTAVFNQGKDTVFDNNDCANAGTAYGTLTSYGMIYSSMYANGQHVEIAGNNLNNLSNIGGITIDSQWIGTSLICDNRMNNLAGSGFDGVNLGENGAVVTANLITNAGNLPIAIGGNNADVENNVVSGGIVEGIAVTGSNMIVRGNTVSNCTVGINVADSSMPTGTPGLVSNNIVTGCPTGLQSTLVNSQLVGNTFSGATKPASGPGSDAVSEVLLFYTTNGTTVINSNTLTNINGVTGISILGSWTGVATISNNTLTAIGGTAIATSAPTTLTGNAINNSGGGIAIFANNCDVENNTLTGGNGTGIYCAADGLTLKNNSFSGQDIGVQLTEPSGGPIAGLVTTIQSNTFNGCYTGIMDGVTNCVISGNGFSAVSKPASGVGSDAVAQIYLWWVTNGSSTINNNTFNNITGISPISVLGNWSGSLTISGNQISNQQGPVGGIVVSSNNTVISGNALQNDSGGISVGGTGDIVQNNSLSTGVGGIYCQGTNCSILNNTLTDSGDPNVGNCIYTYWGHASTIAGNTITKTVPNAAWIPVVYAYGDTLGVNYAYGVDGLNGAFVPGAAGAAPTAPTISITSAPKQIVDYPITPVVSARTRWKVRKSAAAKP